MTNTTIEDKRLENSFPYHFDTTTNDNDNDDDLLQILQLQQQNLPHNLSSQEIKEQGFVTLQHDIKTLQVMCHPYGHIVARSTTTKSKQDGTHNTNSSSSSTSSRIVGYALTMLPHHRDIVPYFKPILDKIDSLVFDGRPLRDLKYCVMGQICIAKDYRGKGIFSGLYEEMSRVMKDAGYNYMITGVAYNNPRSRRAHEKVGFVPLDDVSTKEEKMEHDMSEDVDNPLSGFQNIILRL